ncbi:MULTISPECIES: ATP-binding protein [Curtobacterium]|uniref:ATP-binding protein n=1 Tax=Curtobacterium TaxID=2034 RepID=UPI00217E5D89|nr:ATP-binding protein [Curtobacterium flaccumfaciens]MCS6561369.1 ATP-binding protein [Curtobacterium flaccumfaciens pv. poinsettiae]UXN29289.1 ATP-binding protein [Curtobacterium flaccumfaciens]
MTNDWTLDFLEDEALGRAFRIDTASVWAEAVDHVRLTRIAVGSLIAFQGPSASEFLIGVLDRVTRDLQDEALVDDADQDGVIPVEVRQRDLLRVVLLGTYRTVDGAKKNTFKRGADSYPMVESLCWVLEGENLQKLMGLLTQQLEPEKQLQLGTFVADRSAKAVADGDRLFQRHAALLGSTGSGKSWSVALILERANTLPFPNLIVFDMHGEYAPLTEGEEAVALGLRIAGPGDLGKAGAEGDGALFLPWWLLNQEETQALLLDRSEFNAPNQAARLIHHIRELKQERLVAANKTELAARFTVDSPLPFSLDDLIDRLDQDDKGTVPGANAKDKAGPFNGKLTRLVERMRARTQDRRYGFMFSPPAEASEYDWLSQLAKKLLGTGRGIKVIDFSEVPSDVLPIVVGVLARVLYEIHFWTAEEKRTPVTLVCDEAHLYLPVGPADIAAQRALDSFERIAKEGRKYGISLLVVSQRPSDVSHTVLSQCNNFIVLRLTNDQDQAVIRRLMPDSMEGLTAALPLLDVGEALLLGDALVLPTRIRLDPPKVKPISATKNFWTDWANLAVEDDDIEAAVEAMRRQSRG